MTSGSIYDTITITQKSPLPTFSPKAKTHQKLLVHLLYYYFSGYENGQIDKGEGLPASQNVLF